MNMLDSAEDILDYAEYSDDEQDDFELMMDDYEQIYEGCGDYFEDYQPTEESVRFIASIAHVICHRRRSRT